MWYTNILIVRSTSRYDKKTFDHSSVSIQIYRILDSQICQVRWSNRTECSCSLINTSSAQAFSANGNTRFSRFPIHVWSEPGRQERCTRESKKIHSRKKIDFSCHNTFKLIIIKKSFRWKKLICQLKIHAFYIEVNIEVKLF